jgi:hypothetical protein
VLLEGMRKVGWDQCIRHTPCAACQRHTECAGYIRLREVVLGQLPGKVGRDVRRVPLPACPAVPCGSGGRRRQIRKVAGAGHLTIRRTPGKASRRQIFFLGFPGNPGRTWPRPTAGPNLPLSRSRQSSRIPPLWGQPVLGGKARGMKGWPIKMARPWIKGLLSSPGVLRLGRWSDQSHLSLTSAPLGAE